jgi:hypothetical protein
LLDRLRRRKQVPAADAKEAARVITWKKMGWSCSSLV